MPAGSSWMFAAVGQVGNSQVLPRGCVPFLFTETTCDTCPAFVQGSSIVQGSRIVGPPCTLHRAPQVPHRVVRSHLSLPGSGLADHSGPCHRHSQGAQRPGLWAVHLECARPATGCHPSTFASAETCPAPLSLDTRTGACPQTLAATLLKLPPPLQGPGLPSGLYEFSMDPATGTASHRLVVEGPADFPVINPSFISRRELQVAWFCWPSATQLSGQELLQQPALEESCRSCTCLQHCYCSRGMPAATLRCV